MSEEIHYTRTLLEKFPEIETKTIDALIKEGYKTRTMLLALDVDRDLPHINGPNMGQKSYLRKILIELQSNSNFGKLFSEEELNEISIVSDVKSEPIIKTEPNSPQKRLSMPSTSGQSLALIPSPSRLSLPSFPSTSHHNYLSLPSTSSGQRHSPIPLNVYKIQRRFHRKSKLIRDKTHRRSVQMCDKSIGSRYVLKSQMDIKPDINCISKDNNLTNDKSFSSLESIRQSVETNIKQMCESRDENLITNQTTDSTLNKSKESPITRSSITSVTSSETPMATTVPLIISLPKDSTTEELIISKFSPKPKAQTKSKNRKRKKTCFSIKRKSIETNCDSGVKKRGPKINPQLYNCLFKENGKECDKQFEHWDELRDHRLEHSKMSGLYETILADNQISISESHKRQKVSTNSTRSRRHFDTKRRRNSARSEERTVHLRSKLEEKVEKMTETSKTSKKRSNDKSDCPTREDIEVNEELNNDLDKSQSNDLFDYFRDDLETNVAKNFQFLKTYNTNSETQLNQISKTEPILKIPRLSKQLLSSCLDLRSDTTEDSNSNNTISCETYSSEVTQTSMDSQKTITITRVECTVTGADPSLITDKKFECKLSGCQQLFETKHEFKKHLKSCHLILCDYPKCGKYFGNKYQLIAHKRDSNSHKRQSKRVQRLSKTKDNSNKQLTQSDESLSNERCDENRNKSQFVCDYIGCKKEFKNSLLLSRHKTSHNTYSCDYNGNGVKCGKLFRTDWALRRHLNRHIGQTNTSASESQMDLRTNEADIEYKDGAQYPCPESNCDQKFSFLANLQRHRRHEFIHTSSVQKKKPYECRDSHCDQQFEHLYDLQVHKRTHNEKAYMCGLCGQTFKYRSILKSHKKTIHTKDKPYVCSIDDCKQSFHHLNWLKEHRKTQH